MRDADVVIPLVDRVVLHDTDDVDLPRLDVELETLADVCGEAFDDLSDPERSEQAALIRLRGVLFPTLTERRFMVRAMEPGARRASERLVLPDELLAEWDRGEPVLARASPDFSGLVVLRSPDGRTVACDVSRFGRRMEQRSLVEQFRFQHSFVVARMLRAADGKDEGPGEDPVFPERLFEQASASRPLLMDSHSVRGARAARAQDTGADEVLATWEPWAALPHGPTAWLRGRREREPRGDGQGRAPTLQPQPRSTSPSSRRSLALQWKGCASISSQTRAT